MLKGVGTWKRRLQEVIQAINSESRRILANETPTEAVDDAKVNVKDTTYKRLVGLDEERLPPRIKVSYLYNPGQHEGERRRATDPIWSTKVFDIGRIIVSPDQPVLYYLSPLKNLKTSRRNFVREKLQVVPVDTELPPDHVL